jgi:hypothetical protein
VIRPALAIVLGFLAWFAVATVGNWGLRVFLRDYPAAEAAMSFSVGMLVARLLLGAVASLAAGWACSRIVRQRTGAVTLFALLLTIFFIPVHIGLWAKFPLWYHVAFLASLAPCVSLGAIRSP